MGKNSISICLNWISSLGFCIADSNINQFSLPEFLYWVENYCELLEAEFSD